jgi:hypothetical protein
MHFNFHIFGNLLYLYCLAISNPADEQNIHRKKRFTSFPSPSGMSLAKLPLDRNNSVMTSLFPPRESLLVTSRLRTGNLRTFFYGVWLSKNVINLPPRWEERRGSECPVVGPGDSRGLNSGDNNR